MRRQPYTRPVTILHPVRVREHTQDTDTALHVCVCDRVTLFSSRGARRRFPLHLLTGVAVPSLGCLSSVFSASGHLQACRLCRLQALSARFWLWFDFLARDASLRNSHCITRTVSQFAAVFRLI